MCHVAGSSRSAGSSAPQRSCDRHGPGSAAPSASLAASASVGESVSKTTSRSGRCSSSSDSVDDAGVVLVEPVAETGSFGY